MPSLFVDTERLRGLNTGLGQVCLHLGPALAATVGCSFGFMLPVSTPPNALVYGTGRLSIRDMVSCGILLDVAGAFLVAGYVTLVL